MFHDRLTADDETFGDFLVGSVGRAVRYIQALGARSYEHMEPNLVPIAAFGAIAFPIYYVVWKYLFPQSYENLTLRLVGVGFCALLALKNHWPAPLRKYQRMFYLALLLYCLPFFFTYMLLQNDTSTVWLLSTLAALFLLVLLVDWFHLLVLFFLGSVLAWGAYVIPGVELVKVQIYLEYFPIFMFVVIAGTIFNYKTEFIRQERLRAMNEAALNISNQLQAPLHLIKTGAVSLTKYMPQLIDGVQLAKQHHHPLGEIDPRHLRAIGEVPEKIESEIEHALAVVDMLLMNSSSTPLESIELGRCSMRSCIEQALSRFPYKSEQEQSKVVWRLRDDFVFEGSERLMVHTLLNLLKNALHAVAAKGTGIVEVSTEAGERQNRLAVRDTGTGVPPQLLPRIFERGVTYGGETGSSGTGLRFCKAVIEHFGGTIGLASEYGNFTEVEILLPVATDATGGEPEPSV